MIIEWYWELLMVFLVEIFKEPASQTRQMYGNILSLVVTVQTEVFSANKPPVATSYSEIRLPCSNTADVSWKKLTVQPHLAGSTSEYIFRTFSNGINLGRGGKTSEQNRPLPNKSLSVIVFGALFVRWRNCHLIKFVHLEPRKYHLVFER